MSRALLLLPLLAACQAPDSSAMFNDVQVSVSDATGVSDAFVATIEGATRTLHVALPAGQDAVVGDAILAAWQSGLDVKVVADFDDASSPAIAPLIADGVPVTLADGPVGYFDFALNKDVSWPSTEVRMSHAFVVADHRDLVSATSAGTLDAGARVLLQARGEELVEDVLTEHNQLFGGADATAMTAYNSPQKSVADFRWVYPGTSDAVVEMWLGPQERLTKRIIDAVYGARSSVWVLSADVQNEGFAKALQDKAAWTKLDGTGPAFDMRVVVGPNFVGGGGTQGAVLLTGTPNVGKRRSSDAVVPTIIIVDADAPDGLEAKAFMLTHEMVSSSRIYRSSEVMNDQLIDGTLWVIDDWGAQSPELTALRGLWDDQWNRGEAL